MSGVGVRSGVEVQSWDMGRGSYCKNAKKSGVGARVGVWSGGGPGGVSVGGQGGCEQRI